LRVIVRLSFWTSGDRKTPPDEAIVHSISEILIRGGLRSHQARSQNGDRSSSGERTETGSPQTDPDCRAKLKTRWSHCAAPSRSNDIIDLGGIDTGRDHRTASEYNMERKGRDLPVSFERPR